MQFTESRTTKSLKNSVVALIFCVVELVLKFISRRYFLQYLGTEILGLNTTVASFLSFLNLAELGIGSAIAVTLYKPLFNNDENQINEIISLQGWFYKKVALFVITASSLLSCFFPLIFNKSDLPLWYSYASFGVLLFSAMLGYFVNYKQVVLSADQKEYKIQYSYRFVGLIKVVCQTVAICVFDNAYIYWLILEVIFAILAALVLSITVKKNYPYLKTNTANGTELSKRYPDLLIKIKQLFFHKVSLFVLQQTSSIIIYAYASLTLVAIYGNYTIIVIGLFTLLSAIFNSMGAGVGNLVAEGNTKKIYSVFRELFSSRFLIVTTCAFCFYYLADSFIALWIGEKYILDHTTLILVVITFYINSSRSVVDSFINAYGLFRDIWAPIVEAILNLSLSILLGYFFGLHGILLGVLISLLLIAFTWKPFFLFRNGIKRPVLDYVILYAKHLIAAAVSFILTSVLVNIININTFANFRLLFIGGVILATLFVTIEGLILYLVEPGMKSFVSRMISLIRYK